MSGVSGTGPDDELVVLAGEYVLGTLPREDAAQLEREAQDDPAIAAAIVRWEQQLSPLVRVVAAVAPPATLWPRIEASAYGTPLRRPAADGRPLRNSVAVWRGAAAAGFLAAASVAGIAILQRSPVPVPVAVLAPMGAKAAAFVVEARRGGGVTIVPMSPAAVPAGRDLELWSLAAGEKVPHPLGVLPVGGLTLAADRIPAGPVQILVSLEPAGGSPTGLPTGPVLYGGALSPTE